MSLAFGLVLSVVVILVLLTGYFQSPRLGLISVGMPIVVGYTARPPGAIRGCAKHSADGY